MKPSTIGTLRLMLFEVWEFLTSAPKGAVTVREAMWINITDMGMIVVMIGIFLRIFGEEQWSKKLAGLGLLGTILAKVMSIA